MDARTSKLESVSRERERSWSDKSSGKNVQTKASRAGKIAGKFKLQYTLRFFPLHVYRCILVPRSAFVRFHPSVILYSRIIPRKRRWLERGGSLLIKSKFVSWGCNGAILGRGNGYDSNRLNNQQDRRDVTFDAVRNGWPAFFPRF